MGVTWQQAASELAGPQVAPLLPDEGPFMKEEEV